MTADVERTAARADRHDGGDRAVAGGVWAAVGPAFDHADRHTPHPDRPLMVAPRSERAAARMRGASQGGDELRLDDLPSVNQTG